jgi:DNA-directed RNA polymerase specialized sigma24 family protein
LLSRNGAGAREYGMVTRMPANSETLHLLARARAGDRGALNAIFARYRERLRRMIKIRMDLRLQARIDASDVIQDAFLDVAARLEDYLRDPNEVELTAP